MVIYLQGSLEDLDRKECGPISQLIEYLVTSYCDLLVIPGGSNRLCFVVISWIEVIRLPSHRKDAHRFQKGSISY